MQLYELPDILMINFKRSEFDPRGGPNRKIISHVDFPLEGLDMNKYVKMHEMEATEAPADGYVYDCRSVAHHSGDLGGGHYWSYAK